MLGSTVDLGVTPKGVPAETVAQIERAIQAILANPEFQKEYEADALEAGYMGQKEYRAFMADFVEKQRGFLEAFGVVAN